MASKQGLVFDHSDSFGATWADQWDYSEDRSLHQGNSSNKMSDKVKSAASTGFDKAKVVAAIGAKKIKEGSVTGAKKIKEGSSTGFRWIKVQYQKRAKK
ncbi:hypothetical protein SUGI_1018470 [Cryptomeria japonica]|nr:hypothetical protein SUGI_1018470 [Cryptomeria japonica]